MNTDDPLVARIHSGDQEALVEFLNAARPRLLGYINGQLGVGLRAKIEPEDVAQEVNVEALRTFGKFDLGDRDPFSWLCQLAERRFIDAHRRYFGAQ